MFEGFLESIDLYDKYKNTEFRFHTKISQFMTFGLIIFGSFLLSSELISNFSPKYVRDLSINNKLENAIDFVNISLTIKIAMPCYFLHIDILDSIGFNQLYLNQSQNMRRINKKGKIIGIANRSMIEFCLPCYGLFPDDHCCNSCEELILISMLKGLPPTPNNWTQCTNRVIPQVSLDEDCLIKGKFKVNRVSGTFHIAPGRNRNAESPFHSHDLSSIMTSLNMTHTVDRVRFGPKIPTASNPLNNISIIQKSLQPISSRYHLLVTPILFQKSKKELTTGFEYTVMLSNPPVLPLPGMFPGIFFHYSFTPYYIVVTPIKKNIFSFLASTFGILTGAYSIASLIDLYISKNHVM